MKRNLLCAILAALICAVSLASCGESYTASPSAKQKAEYGYDLAAERSVIEEVGDSTASSSSKNATAETPQKIIKNVELDVSTAQFDDFVSGLTAATAKAGGYVEGMNASSYDESVRSAYYTIRVPAEKLDDFLGQVSALGKVNNRNESQTNVTASYVDVESRLKAVEAEQEALLALLAKASSVAEILEIQDRLSDVRGELESYKGQLKLYDDQVSYSTVRLTVTEEKRASYNEKEGFFARIGSEISDSFFNLLNGLTDVTVWFFGAMPYWLFFAILVLIVFLIVHTVRKKQRARRKKQTEAAENTSDPH